jgi:hypothetical protein
MIKIDFIIVAIKEKDLNLIKKIFKEKYDPVFWPLINEISSRPITSIFKENYDKTLILDVKTFYKTKEFLTNQVYCFSNESHKKFRYDNSRKVTYFGSYDYQNFDEFCLLKLNFDAFSNYESLSHKIFISSPDQQLIKDNIPEYRSRFPGKEIILKKSSIGKGNIFEEIDTILYVHTGLDTNNRIIPEAHYYEIKVLIDDLAKDVTDSVTMRNNDIIRNGIIKYKITKDDIMISRMLDE